METAATVSSRRGVLPSSNSPRLHRHGSVQLLLRSAHVLVGFLQRIKLLLLIWIEQRTDLRHGAVDYRLSFLHCVLVDGHDLWASLIKNWLHLRLLIGGEIQRLGQMLESKGVPVMPAQPLGLSDGEAAERDRDYSGECQ